MLAGFVYGGKRRVAGYEQKPCFIPGTKPCSVRSLLYEYNALTYSSMSIAKAVNREDKRSRR
jgi:hypothetical protein